MKIQLSSGTKTPALQLHRIVRLGDKLDTHVFTFVLPSQLTRGFLQFAQSKEFSYGGQKWQIRLEYYNDPLDTYARRGSFVVHYQKQPLGISLQACNLAGGVKLTLDYVRFTVIHQEHFSRNLIREEIGTNFTHVQPFIKVPRWIESGFLAKEHYLFDDWSALLEVEVRGAVTAYEEQLRVPRGSREALRCNYLESASFPYAGADWSLSIDWKTATNRSSPSETEARPLLSIQRHSRTKHWTRVRFRALVNWHDLGSMSTGTLDQLMAPESGACTTPVPIGDRSWFPSLSGPYVTPKCRIVIRVEFIMAIPMSRVDLVPTEPQTGKNCSRVSDPEGFDWIVMSDILGSLVKLRLFPDPENLVTPKKEDVEGTVTTRSTSIGVQLIPYDSSTSIVKSAKPFYTCTVPLIAKSPNDNRLEVGDICKEVVLNLDVEKVCSSEFGYSRPTDNGITLRIEWLHTCFLNRGDYHAFDDLENLQRYQMLQELHYKSSELRRLQSNCKPAGDAGTAPQQNPPIRRGQQPPVIDEPVRNASKLDQNQYDPELQSKRHESAPTLQRSYNVHRRSHQDEFLSLGNNSPRFHTPPPIYVNESPARNGSDGDTATPGTLSSWRRHSSCLEEVGSSNQRTRRRLPSPPTSAIPTTPDGYLAVNFVGPPQSTRCSVERYGN